MFTGEEPGLYSSIHSSFALADVPDQATSLIKTNGELDGVEVLVAVGVCVGVEILVGVEVGVGVGFPHVCIGLEVFCGSLGFRRKKSEALLLESTHEPELSGFRS
jgi:hypothetical protein